MKYGHYDGATGRLLGWYSRDVHATIPVPSVEVSDDVWQNALSNNWNHVAADGSLSFVDFATLEERQQRARGERNVLLMELDAVVGNPLRWAGFSDGQKAECAAYRQQLLDVPAQAGFPDNVVWPQKPAVLSAGV